MPLLKPSVSELNKEKLSGTNFPGGINEVKVVEFLKEQLKTNMDMVNLKLKESEGKNTTVRVFSGQEWRRPRGRDDNISDGG